MINPKRLQGMGVAMVTPFKSNKEIDFDALEKLTEFLIQNGTDYLVVQGTTGESPNLTASEKEAVLNTVIKINNKRLPIVYGIGGNNTMAVAEQLKNFTRTDVDAILSVSPYYNKPTQNGIFEHFKTLSEASNHPIILYNVPGRTSSNMLASTTIKLAESFNNIIAVKEASGNLEQVMDIINKKPKDFLVISGDDALTMPFVAAGGDGVISVVGNGFPKLFSDMVKFGLNNETEKARALHYKVYAIIEHLFSEGNPAGIKEVLAHLGLMENHVRLPLVNVSESTKNILINITKSIN